MLAIAALLVAALAVPAGAAAERVARPRLLVRRHGNTEVQVVIGVGWRNQTELDQFLIDVADPRSADFNRYLTAQAFESRFGPTSHTRAAIKTRLRERGFTSIDTATSSTLFTAVAPTDATLPTRFISAADLLDGAQIPLAAMAVSAPGQSGSSRAPSVELRPPTIGPSLPPQEGGPFRPDDIARIYGFDRLYGGGISGTDDRGSTIAIATALDLDRDALQRFWREVGIDRTMDSIEVIPVNGPLATTHTETTLDTEWASAMAPGARILVYAAADTSTAAFLQVYDRIVRDNRAAVMTTSWGLCEREVPSAMRQQAHAIFQRAAAQGITTIAASGDNGAFDCGDASPGVSFPASDPLVLAVGGTSVHDEGGGVSESAWQGSGGGWSSAWSAPPWQMMVATGRVMADVAFNADPGSGFLAYVDGGWWNFGGTSVSAPCWAALVALINQRRVEAGRDTLGLAAPALCEIAHSPALVSHALRDVMTGHNNGFPATPGWDFPTGWGTPQASNLAEALATWDPPADPSGATSESLVFTPGAAGSTGAILARFAHRCMTKMLQLRARGVPPGSYVLEMDAQPLASFDVGSDVAVLDLVGVDPHGHVLEVRDANQTVLFSADWPASPSPPLQLRVPLLNTGVLDGAIGMVTYRRSGGREQFAVVVRGVPAGTYAVRVGAEQIGSLTINPGQRGARVAFDSAGVSGRAVGVSPLCTVVAVLSNEELILRTRSTAFTVESCPARSQ